MQASRVERLPFTVYDVMGYFAPGAYLVLHFIFLFSPELQKFMRENTDFAFFGVLTIILITSYAVGHGLALVASETIERLWIAFIGYPSKSAEEKNKCSEKRKQYLAACRQKFWSGTCFERVIKRIFLTLFGLHTFVIWLIVKTPFIKLVIKPIDSDIWSAVAIKFKDTFGRDLRLNSSDTSNTFESDDFKVIDHYIFSKNAISASRQYNYVTIYGFCRNMCLATYLVFWMHLITLACTGVNFLNTSVICVYYNVNYLQMMFNLVLSLILLVSFAKFFRRYTHDALMTFAITTDANENKPVS